MEDGRTHYIAPIAELSTHREWTFSTSFGHLKNLLGPPNTTDLENCEKVTASWAFEDDQGRKGFVWAYRENPETCVSWSAAGDLELLVGLLGAPIGR